MSGIILFPSGPTLIGILPYAGLKFYVYEELKRHVPEEQQNSIVMRLSCGALAGLFGQTLTYPLDVVRRQMQVVLLTYEHTCNILVEIIAYYIGNCNLFRSSTCNLHCKVVPDTRTHGKVWFLSPSIKDGGSCLRGSASIILR